VFYPPEGDQAAAPAVINPRGFRAYVRNDTFFRSIPLVAKRQPGVRFYCTGMANEPQAHRWLERLNSAGVVELLPALNPEQLGDLFRRCQVSASPSTHDGTPNTLLEAMACGCFPVAGDLESLREWITPGVNGLLVDPGDPQALAEAILLALEQPQLRRQAMETNTRLVSERAEYGRVMRAAEAFIQSLV
jgi:glycosyltransferase involved in cell wall biosynthesis